MDPLTHATLGALTAAAVVRKKDIPWHQLLVAAGFAAMLPDLDLLAHLLPVAWVGPMGGEYWHRHFTHSLVVIPLGGLLAAWLVQLLSAGRWHWRELWPVTTLGFATHWLLDFITTSGVALFWPFTEQRYGVGLMPVIDPYFSAGLAFCLLLAWRFELRRYAVVGLLAALSYVGAQTLIAHQVAAQTYKINLARGVQMVDLQSVPKSPLWHPYGTWYATTLTREEIIIDQFHKLPFMPLKLRDTVVVPRVYQKSLKLIPERPQTHEVERFFELAQNYVGPVPGQSFGLGNYLAISLKDGCPRPVKRLIIDPTYQSAGTFMTGFGGIKCPLVFFGTDGL